MSGLPIGNKDEHSPQRMRGVFKLSLENNGCSRRCDSQYEKKRHQAASAAASSGWGRRRAPGATAHTRSMGATHAWPSHARFVHLPHARSSHPRSVHLPHARSSHPRSVGSAHPRPAGSWSLSIHSHPLLSSEMRSRSPYFPFSLPQKSLKSNRMICRIVSLT